MGDFTLPADGLSRLDLVELDSGVFRTPLLTPAACMQLLREVERRRFGLPSSDAPNSMHEHGVRLGPLGLDGVALQLRRHLAPDLARLYPEMGGRSIDGHHAYLVEYGAGADEELGFHVDDSEITLNVCLGDEFSGAELVMLGRRCDSHRQSAVAPGEVLEIDHEPGFAILHAGKHRHRVDPIRRGRRRNLIAWLKSSTYRATTTDACPVWCGLHR